MITVLASSRQAGSESVPKTDSLNGETEKNTDNCLLPPTREYAIPLLSLSGYRGGVRINESYPGKFCPCVRCVYDYMHVCLFYLKIPSLSLSLSRFDPASRNRKTEPVNSIINSCVGDVNEIVGCVSSVISNSR